MNHRAFFIGSVAAVLLASTATLALAQDQAPANGANVGVGASAAVNAGGTAEERRPEERNKAAAAEERRPETGTSTTGDASVERPVSGATAAAAEEPGPGYGYGYDGPAYGPGPAYGYGYGPASGYGPDWGEPDYGPAAQPAPVAAAPVPSGLAAGPMIEGRAAFLGSDTYTYRPTPSIQYTNGNGGHWDAFEDENPMGEYSAQQIRTGR